MAVSGEDPVLTGETVQGGARAAVRGPRHLAHRARPGQGAHGRQRPFDERPIELRVVRDDEIRSRDERGGGLHIDAAPAHVVVGQAGQCGDFGIERAAGVLEVDLGLVMQDLRDAPVGGVREGQHRDLDGQIAFEAQTRGFAVDVERAAKWRVAGVAQARGQLERAQGAGAGGGFAEFVHRVLSSSGWCHGRGGGAAAELLAGARAGIRRSVSSLAGLPSGFPSRHLTLAPQGARCGRGRRRSTVVAREAVTARRGLGRRVEAR